MGNFRCVTSAPEPRDPFDGVGYMVQTTIEFLLQFSNLGSDRRQIVLLGQSFQTCGDRSEPLSGDVGGQSFDRMSRAHRVTLRLTEQRLLQIGKM